MIRRTFLAMTVAASFLSAPAFAGEKDIVDTANGLGIGPMGFGGETTLLGCKVTERNRLPASFFVSVSYACWAHRRRGVVLDGATDNIVRWLYTDAEEVLPGGHPS